MAALMLGGSRSNGFLRNSSNEDPTSGNSDSDVFRHNSFIDDSRSRGSWSRSGKGLVPSWCR
ncbi:hypothetical protein MES4922_180135 [Mesorhizobium ventifaucium]|uniref:Uncharacterized protein n=1 Tax=Mesorhizobium ventifaucium TaxID=666020 RepID=A0ABM9DKB0_9HYPH|nr:hypothetical protein MES4922_180135 [Mesorhizobium ventifaucium]